MTEIIVERPLKINNYLSHSSVVSKHPADSFSDLAAKLLNSNIRKNIESFYRQFSKLEVEVFKYLCYYFRMWQGNIQIPIKNLMARFGLKERRIHYILSKLNTFGVLQTIQKGHTGNATKRTLPERGLMLWKAISKGFGVVKQDIPRTSADSHADSTGGHTKYISSQVDIPLRSSSLFNREEAIKREQEHALITPEKRKSIVEGFRERLRML
jgi:hypothetical protein